MLLLVEMEATLMQSPVTAMDKASHVVLDIESLIQTTDKCCSGSPKMTKALSRKGSCRMDRRNGEEQEADEATKKLVVKVPSQLEQLKQPLMANKALITVQSSPTNTPISSERLKSLVAINPRKILLLFATVSSVGTMILIYFTLSMNRRAED